MDPGHGDGCSGLVDDDSAWVCCDHGFDQAILTAVFGEIHGLAVIAFRLPFSIKANDENRDVCFACDIGGFLETVNSVFFLVTNAASTVVVTTANDGYFR